VVEAAAGLVGADDGGLMVAKEFLVFLLELCPIGMGGFRIGQCPKLYPSLCFLNIDSIGFFRTGDRAIRRYRPSWVDVWG